MRRFAAALIAAFLTLCGAAVAAPPNTPTITEPGTDNMVLNPADVHMEAPTYSDPDGNPHSCTDWEIVEVSTGQVAWQAPCVVGVSRVHIHLGDGTFVNAHAGMTQLKFETSYRLRVRFKDSTNAYSAWQERPFSTSPAGPPGVPSAVPWAARQSGYVVEVVATGFQLPMNIAMVPNPGNDPGDPFMYVTELYGKVKVVTRSGAVSDYATGLLNFNPTGNFPGSGEQGLGGIVVHPVTGDLYVSMVYSSVPGVEAAPHYPKVVRFTSTDGGRTAATQTTILDMPGETMGQSHFISNVSINPNDGTLMVHVGDGFTTATAQNPDLFRGKILRLNLDGSAPADNPFYDASNGINARDYTFAMGFRNPFGGAWRQADGMHYEVENGPSVDRMAQIVAGRNYLWDGTNASMANFATYNWNPAHAPVNLLFIQQNTFNGSAFPASKLDHMFVSESGPTYASGAQANGKRITEFVLDAQGNLVTGPIDFLTYTGSGKGTVVALAAGTDGIYFSELYKDQNFDSPIDRGARVFRVRVLDAVRPTVAAANFLYQTSPTRLTLGFSENVSASLSLADIAVQNTTTQTPFNPTGLTYDALTNTATFTFPAGAIPDGNYRATLLADGVTDAAGNALAQDFNVDFFFLQGDANHDGAVNLNDFNALAANFGQSNRNFSHGDFNYDGTVNLQDFNLLAARFGAVLAPSKTSVFDDVDDEEEEDDRTPGDLIA